VTEVTSGGITGFTWTGSGVDDTSVFSLEEFLYTATSYDSFTVIVDGIVQRPYLDYTFSSGTLTFLTIPAPGADIAAQSAVVGSYWQYVDSADLTSTDNGGDVDGEFGASITTDQTGTQILVGAPYDSAEDQEGNTIANAGAVYAFDRSVIKLVITDASQLTYAIPGPYATPVTVILNNQYLTNTDQYIDGQFTIVGSDVVLSESISLTLGDILQIETNQFQLIQRITADTVIDESLFGKSIDICSNNCSAYVGAPLDSSATGVPQAGMVERQVNQSRIYGIISSNIANPTLTAGDTVRINQIDVEVPASPNNTVAGLVDAINTAKVPNATALTTPDVRLDCDGQTKIFDIGNIYSVAESYTTVV
jgi:hypothetical protein